MWPATRARGAAEAVFECAANLACVGAEPLGLTNCLNFGNPEKPHVAWQLASAVEGLAWACEALGVPVVGGNVSLYNEGPAGPIYPTPVVGMVGKLPDAARAGRSGLRLAGRRDRPGGSLRGVAGRIRAREAPRGGPGGRPADAERAPRVPRTSRSGTPCATGALTSAHDIAEGGLAVALAECCLAGGIGATVTVAGWRRGAVRGGARLGVRGLR